MTKTKLHSKERGRRKWPWLIFAVLLMIILVLRFSLMSQTVQNLVKNQILKSAESQLALQLDIDEVKGDLWKEILITGVKLRDGDKTVASVDSVYAGYNLLSYFSSAFKFSEVVVTRPFFRLEQQKSTGWNAGRWIKKVRSDTTSVNEFPVMIANLKLHEGKIDGRMENSSRDSVFSVNNINLNSRLDYYGEDFEIDVSSFGFNIVSSRLEESVSVESKAKADAQTISLEKLVMATRNSVLRSSGLFSMKDSSRLGIDIKPLSWKDLAAFAEDSPLREDLSVSLILRGNLKRFNADLDIQASGMEQFNLDAGLHYDSEWILHKASAKASQLNLPDLVGDVTLPVLNNLAVNIEGEVPLNRVDESRLKGSFRSSEISWKDLDLSMDKISGDLEFADNNLVTKLNAEKEKQSIDLKGVIENPFDSSGRVEVSITGKNLNPGHWMKDKSYNGAINLAAVISGSGFDLRQSSWKYDIRFNNSEWLQQHFDKARLRGKVSYDMFTNESAIHMSGNEVNVSAAAENMFTTPEFSYTVVTSNFDLSEFRNMKTFPTSVSAEIEGRGKGNTIENLQLENRIRVDNSIINGEKINELTADVRIKDTVATVSKAAIESSIAEGFFDGNVHLNDLYRVTNRLSLDLKIKDLSALSPLIKTDKLQARGNVTGELLPDTENRLVFSGNVGLSDIHFDNSFSAEQAEGNIKITLSKESEFDIDLQLTAPRFYSVNLQNVVLQTKGKLINGEAGGSFDLALSSTREGSIRHSGTFSATEDAALIETLQLKLNSSSETLSLEKPFNMRIRNNQFRMDTLLLKSGEGSFLTLSVPYADSTTQKGYLEVKNLNLTTLQNTLLGKTYAEGMLSGSLEIERQDSMMSADGNLLLSDIIYRQTSLDTLDLQANIRDGYLNTELNVTDEDKQVLVGRSAVPFTLDKPETIEDDFFDQPVEGTLKIDRIALNDFENLLTEFGITGTEGILSVDGTLQGNAGMPEIKANLTLDKPVLSGVKSDSVTALVDYNHKESKLSFNAAVNSLGQTAADINAEIPFKIDLIDFDLSIPQKTDSVFVDIRTNKFNLEAFNDFIGTGQVRDFKGFLDGRLELTGLPGSLRTDGEFRISGGSVRIIPAGIRVEEISSTMLFERDEIRLTEFRAKSGKGSLNVRGIIGLQKMAFDTLDMNITAANFRAANTSAYNAVINSNVSVQGTFSKPEITGELRFQNGFIELQNFGEKSVEAINLDTEKAEDELEVLYNSLNVDLDVRFDRRFFVRNSRFLELETELEGEVKLLKNADKELQSFGAISIASGFARPLGKRFDIEEGNITFSGNPRNPAISVRSVFEPPQPEGEIKIWYIIGGTLNSPTFDYESQPEMELESIISYTLFGKPFYELDSWQQVVSNSGGNTRATDLAVEVLMDRLESLASQKLGIDVVKIDSAPAAGETGTALTTGWYISPRVFFAIQNVISGSNPDTSFLLEYMLKNNLKLIITQGNESRQGVDLEWNYDY